MTASNDALKSLLYATADDLLILGHRNSEWTGLGPILEEDIAFSSMAQDQMGQSLALYEILHRDLGEKDPDTIAFLRPEAEYRCCHLVEYPIGDYAFSLMRHFLFDQASYLRFASMAQSSFEPLAQVARKVLGEIKYHIMHGNTWVAQVSQGTEESRARMQSALNETVSLALGLFEPLEHEQELIDAGVYPGAAHLRAKWLEHIEPTIAHAGLQMPAPAEAETSGKHQGGRKGYHSEHLAPLIEEMGEVLRSDPSADW
jgi:ring-1,2-phenylacetyl-CoA epoxidase subunit PaaC